MLYCSALQLATFLPLYICVAQISVKIRSRYLSLYCNQWHMTTRCRVFWFVDFFWKIAIFPYSPLFYPYLPQLAGTKVTCLEAEMPLLQLRTVARSDHVGGSIIEADFEKNPTFWNLVTIDFVLQFRTSGHPNYIQCLRSKHFDQQQLAGVG